MAHGGSLSSSLPDGRAFRSVSVMRNMLMRVFGCPQGPLGRLGGIIMARTNAECGLWVTELLEIGPYDTVLKVGFGPGVVIQRLSKLAAHVSYGQKLVTA